MKPIHAVKKIKLQIVFPSIFICAYNLPARKNISELLSLPCVRDWRHWERYFNFCESINYEMFIRRRNDSSWRGLMAGTMRAKVAQVKRK
jgi:hypothetical protein